jgi:hypothetical protein
MDRTPDYDDFAEQVRERLAQLRKRDRTGQFRLRKPAAEEDVAGYEHRHGITFPEPYRTFLLKVTDGGTGLYSLGSHFFNDDGPGPEVGDPRKPFPHAVAWNEESEFVDTDRDLTDEEEERLEAWRENYDRPELVDGAVPLADEGCAHYALLVVTGPQRGNVWMDSRGSEEGIYPVTDAQGGHVTFAEWYMTWLDGLCGAGFGE